MIYLAFFQDQEQVQSITESILISLIIQCSSHAPQSEFLLFATKSLCGIGYLKWDSLLPSLLSSVSNADSQASSSAGPTSSTAATPTTSNLHVSNPTSPLSAINQIGSPTQSSTLDQSTITHASLAKPTDNVGASSAAATGTGTGTPTISQPYFGSLRQLCCKIILSSLETNLKPLTHGVIFQHMIDWLVNWNQRPSGLEETIGSLRSWGLDTPLHEWMHLCLDVVWILVDEDKCRVPFYELLRSSLQYMENIPNDEAMFSIIMEIHRRRDMVAMHMQMLDQHLHCPTFATHRFLSQSYPSIPGEPIANLRYSPITYPSVLGEPLHGEVSILFTSVLLH